MATLSHGPRLNARTTARIHTAVKKLALDATTQGMTFQGRAVTSEAIISAILVEFLEITEDKQLKFLEPAMRKLEKELT